MATRSTYLKIGIFVVLAGCAVILAGILIGVGALHRRHVSVYTFFDEPVTGLLVGSPVQARGVPIGQVGEITFAPDHRMVQVRMDINVDDVVRLGLAPPDETGHIHPPPNLRAQLGSLGLTGGRYIALDYFNPKTNPPPLLPFPTPPNYIPAARSVQNTLEEAVTTAMNGLAALVETLHSQRLGERVVQTTTEADAVLELLRQVALSLKQQNLPERAAAVLEELRRVTSHIDRILDQLGGKSGLIATTQRSMGAVGEASHRIGDTTRNLNETLEEIRAAAASVRALADTIEREPDILLKGRRQKGKR